MANANTNEHQCEESKVDEADELKDTFPADPVEMPTLQPTAEEPFEAEMLQLKQQATEFKDKYLRGLAESENARKRLQKEKQELAQYAIQNALADFLSPIDHFEMALKFAEQAQPEVQNWAIGFQMILNQLKDALANSGVVPFASIGVPFDHNCHEAVEMVETDLYAPGIIIEESLRGYKMGDRIIRPARVKVAKPVSSPSLAEEEQNNQN